MNADSRFGRFHALILCAALLIASVGCASRAGSVRESFDARHPLVVLLVVDQMRAQYLEDYGDRFTAGLGRLMHEGAWFRRAAYPYLNTVTCAGHSTIGTGALPYRHGMILNAWWDRQRTRLVSCTGDASVKAIGYMGSPTGGDSAALLLLPPLGQQIRERTGGRSVAMSLKARSSITLVGRDPTAVTWFDDRAGWTTSSAFAAGPVDWVQRFIAENPVERDRNKVWDRLFPADAYRGDDAGKGERAPTGWTTTFPHQLGQPAAQFLAQWQRSPFADAYLARFAADAIDTLELGRGQSTDFIGVSFSTLDLVGHQYGPRSHEVQDVLFRLDREIGALLDHLDARLGRNGYVLALSADHGVADIPEQTGAGRESSAAISAAVDKALVPLFGAGKYVVRSEYTDVYLAPGIYEKVRQSPEASRAVIAAIAALPGMAHAFLSDEVAGADARNSDDPVRRAAALSYHPGRSGDLIVVPDQNWLLSSSATTHGTMYPYDQRVPVIFFGAGVKAATYDTPATPADIAPTLAGLAGVPFRQTDGSPLLRR
jgi:predicted AlkP superfamily pyrophosphatase or phosphodiesterase